MEPGDWQSLLALVKVDWFSERTASTFWIQIYSSAGYDYEAISEFYRRAESGVPGLPNDVTLRYGRFGGQLNHLNAAVSVNGDGQIGFRFVESLGEVPECPCLFIATPHKVDGSVAREATTKERLGQLVTMLRSHIGKNSLFELLHDAEHNADTGKPEILYSDSVTVPSGFSGPWLCNATYSSAAEIFNTMRLSVGSRQVLFSNALRYFARGIDAGDFYSYWTCLEILAGGGAPKIRSVLHRCYGLKRQHDVDDVLGFRSMREWRHRLIHFGQDVFLSSSVDRYIQLMIIDVMRFSLSLSSKNFALGFAGKPGVNLSDIGMHDNRTDEERVMHAAMERGLERS